MAAKEKLATNSRTKKFLSTSISQEVHQAFYSSTKWRRKEII
jgi:hypothetical protein